MQQDFPFQPFAGAANTTNLAVTGSSQQLTLPPMPQEGGAVILTNIGTQTVFIALGNVTASVSTSMPLLAGSAQSMSVPGGMTQISCIAAGAGSTLYATGGCGK